MRPGVQLISEPNETCETLCLSLTKSGHPVALSAPDTPFWQQGPPPAIYIVDLACFEMRPENDWSDFVTNCREQGSACLVFHSTGQTNQSCLDALKPAAEWLFDPCNFEEVAARIDTLLTIQQLKREHNEIHVCAQSQQKELLDAFQSAAEIQQRLIPEGYPQYQQLSYAWRFMPSRKVGGDLFNVARLDENTVMTYLVDVSGHGISSAMVSVAIQQTLSPRTGHIPKRQTSTPPHYTITSPADVMAGLEREFPFERFEEFFTLVYLLIDEANGKVRYCSAGHPAPVLIRSNGQIQRLTAGGTIIGLGNLVDFEEGEIRMAAGDRLFLYTDGVTEHGLSTGEAFGEQRLIDCLRAHPSTGLEGTLEHTIQSVRQFGDSHEPQDDITLIGIRYSGQELTGSVRQSHVTKNIPTKGDP